MFARVLTIVLSMFFVAGCEKTDDANIDKWMNTDKGPGKLRKAIADEDLDPDLSAHAAANLIKKQEEKDLVGLLDTMSPARRTVVLAKLAPKLWDIARIENDNKLPGGTQIAGKDGLVTIRKWADDTLRQQIDGYLIDWYGVSSYDGRAEGGQYSGESVARMIGPPIAKKLIGVLNGVIAAPGQEKVKLKITDKLMLALAASGSPEAVKKLLDVAKMDRGDDTLSGRAITALFIAYVKPSGLFPILGPEALVPNLDGLVAIAKDDTLKGQTINDTIELIRAVGSPKCFTALVGMVPHPHRQSVFKFVTATNAMRCGGAKSIGEVVKALPEGGAYVQADLAGTVILEIAHMTPRNQVLDAVRQLLGAKSTIAKWVAIEALAAMKSVEDKPKIAALAGNKERLVGYWGESAGKPDPTLGQRAKELADQLGADNKPK